MLKNENIIFNIPGEQAFREVALGVFNRQYQYNPTYRQWVDHLKIDPAKVTSLAGIPFLPIEIFKTAQVVSSPVHAGTVLFKSSATTSQTPSVHYVNDIDLYKASFTKGFEAFYGDVREYCFLALLPGYLERGDSSLVYMCTELMRLSGNPLNGFFLNQPDTLTERINEIKRTGQKTILVGVSYALIDLCDRQVRLFDNFIVMETGGMKGTRRELLKPELHAYLKNGFHIDHIHSEYGMTELLSQAYSRSGGLFEAPPWMRFLIREVNDPLKIRQDHKTGGINVIDLANQHSCAFIATSDLGRLLPDGRLELMGRYDNSDVRGCNLMLGGF